MHKRVSSALSSIPSGLLAVYKPAGPSSSDVVGTVKKLLISGAKSLTNDRSKFQLKVGHGGTLDPMATGVLVLGVGNGTKALEKYLKGNKGYRAVAKLGIGTDTLDRTGVETARLPWEHVTLDELRRVSEGFVGDILQTPPMYSALRSNGVRLHTLARQGVVVDRPARPVTVFSLEVSDRAPGTGAPPLQLPEYSLDVECSGGFYIRSLIADIGEACKTASVMMELERTKQGPFLLEHCVHPGDWSDFQLMCDRIALCSTIANVDADLLQAPK
jgi:tRNA pseudouridine55 synthase